MTVLARDLFRRSFCGPNPYPETIAQHSHVICGPDMRLRRVRNVVILTICGLIALAAAASWWRSFYAYDRVAAIRNYYHGDALNRWITQLVAVRGSLILDSGLHIHA